MATPRTHDRSASVVAVDRLSKWFGARRALNNVTFEIRRGEFVGLLGPNGAGKSTLTKILMGFIRPTAGTVRLFGSPVLPESFSTRRRAALVPDQYDFYGNLDAHEHLAYLGELARMDPSTRLARSREVLQAVGAEAFAHRRVSEYSHGMKQRLCIAIALLNKPEFLILDEPTNGLDPQGIRDTLDILRRLREEGITVLLNSHQLAEVQALCSRAIVLAQGRVVADAPIARLRKGTTLEEKFLSLTGGVDA